MRVLNSSWHQHQSTGGTAASSDAEKKAARLAKLQAWKLQQAGGVSSAQHPAPPVTMVVHQAHPISPPTALPLPAQGGGQGDEDEVDPLDAFMAEMKELEKASDAQAPSARAAGKSAAERFDELDPAADFLEVGLGTALFGGLTVKSVNIYIPGMLDGKIILVMQQE